MDVAYISALSALAGSVVGSLTSAVTAWVNQRFQARAARISNELVRRQNLYRDFIVRASKAHGRALVTSEPNIEELIGLYSLISRMRALSSPRIVACAEQVLLDTTSTYFEPNKSVPELRELIKSRPGLDPLRNFAEAVREEQEKLSLV